MDKWKFELGAHATLISGEAGTIIGRAEYHETTPSYLLRYKAADGRLCEQWWNGEAFASR